MFKNALSILESSSDEEHCPERDLVRETPKSRLKSATTVIDLVGYASTSDQPIKTGTKRLWDTSLPCCSEKLQEPPINDIVEQKNISSARPLSNFFSLTDSPVKPQSNSEQPDGKRMARRSTGIIEISTSGDDLPDLDELANQSAGKSKPRKLLKRSKQKITEIEETAENCSLSSDDISVLRFVNETSLKELELMLSGFSLEPNQLLAQRPLQSLDDFELWLKREHKMSNSQRLRLKESILSTIWLDSLLETIEQIRISCQNSFVSLEPSKILSKSAGERFALKSYQLHGVSWLNNLYQNGLGGILADEMGLGKTVQVISLISYLVNQAIDYGPFLIITPSSTMDNWYCEFQKWAPHLKIAKYYGTIDERFELRDSFSSNITVIITTFSMATSSKEDKKFLRRIQPSILFVDEGHFLKNWQSQKYLALFSIPAEHSFLLTGTPLQNERLKELFSLNSSRKESSKNSEVCIEKIKRLIEPFVLRRKKSDVLSDLPEKEEQIIECEMTANQILISKEFEKNQSKYNSNILIHLRKAANHALLFRTRYTDDMLKLIARQLLCEPDFSNYSSLDDIEQELAALNDYQIHATCSRYSKRLARFALQYEDFLDSGKTAKTLEIVQQIIKNDPDEKILFFSQYLCILDIMSDIFDYHHIPTHRLDGSMAVSERHALMNSFNTNENIKIFLLSSKAAGFGINLVSANHVIIHDIDYNPHNDKQAEDRCHRIGQSKSVKIYKLISKDSVEEKALDIALYKIKLDAKFQ